VRAKSVVVEDERLLEVAIHFLDDFVQRVAVELDAAMASGGEAPCIDRGDLETGRGARRDGAGVRNGSE
jgi:hypothetical protein